MRLHCARRASSAFVFTFGVLAALPAEAVPNFARKYELSCNVCHTREPRLNSFGRRFQENGYQLPGTEDGGETKKQHFGTPRHPLSPDSVSNFLSVRLRADIQQSQFRGETEATREVDFVFPNVVNLFIAGTATKNISFFLETEFAPGEESEEASVGFERVLLVFSNIGPKHQALNAKVGEFDPSALFAFPTHRQQMSPIFVDGESEDFPPEINRIPLLPLAFSAKMYGLTRGPEAAGREGFSILPFEPILFNAPSARGAALYGRPLGEGFLYQVGAVQAETAEDQPETSFQPYVMARYDFPVAKYRAAQISGFYYHAADAARPALKPGDEVVFAQEAVDWTRYGVGARVQFKFFDIYGAAIWDRIETPAFGSPVLNLSEWETEGFGLSLEVDWLVNESWMLGTRYDSMNPGGLSKLPPALQGNDPILNQDVSFLSLIAKYYPVPNIGLYARGHYNLSGSAMLPGALGGGPNPSGNLKAIFTLGVDMAF